MESDDINTSHLSEEINTNPKVVSGNAKPLNDALNALLTSRGLPIQGSQGPRQLYTTMDGFENGVSACIIYTVAILIFGGIVYFAISNICKFYRHRSYALGLFYVFTILNNLVRCFYFLTCFLSETSYWNVIFMCFPGSMSCAIGLCQVMNYLVLYIRLESYAKHRANQGGLVTEDELNKTTITERVVTIGFTVAILAYPIAISILLGLHHQDYDNDVILAWQRYELFYMFNFIGIAILLVISTFLSLSHMRKVFGKESMQEEKSIKLTLILFTVTYLCRVVFALIMHFKEEWIQLVFKQTNTIFMLVVLLLWILWDCVPLVSMLLIHRSNFSSFSSDEILYTEYSIDDQNDGFDQRYTFNDLTVDVAQEIANQNALETSGVINLGTEVSSSESSKGTETDYNDLSCQTLINNQNDQRSKSPSVLSKSHRNISFQYKTQLIQQEQQDQLAASGSLDQHKSGTNLSGRMSGTRQSIKNLLLSRSRSKTSRTVSVSMLKWSLARSIRMGIFSQRVFTKEITKQTSRKSTFTRKSVLLVNPESEEYQQMQLFHSRRSRSTQNINASSSSSSSDSDIGDEF